MRTAQMAFAFVMILAVASVATADVAKPGKPCLPVACLVDPCTTTTCKPSNKDWQCVANYCGGCNTDWKNKKTGLTVSKCPPDACPEIFQPVCGTDGKTYSSACNALQNGVKVASNGECKKKCNIVQCLVDPCTTTTCKPANKDWQCVANYCGGCNTDWKNKKTGLKISRCPPDACTQMFAPVCGVDGKTYGNSCTALTVGIKVAYTGPCKCPKTNSPVCGADGATYRNRCLAINNSTTVAYAGTCSFPVKCAKANLKYKPVCDATTSLVWANSCVAKLNKVAKPTDGPCVGPICAMCIMNGGCNAPHRCKGNKKYTCELASCKISHILDNGKRVQYDLCKPIYRSQATGYPAAACFP